MAGGALAYGVYYEVGRYLDVLHPDLISVVARRRAPQGEQQHLRQPGPGLADAVHYPRVVVVTENPVWPGVFGERRLVLFDEPTDRSGFPLCQQDEAEVERQVDAV